MLKDVVPKKNEKKKAVVQVLLTTTLWMEHSVSGIFFWIYYSYYSFLDDSIYDQYTFSIETLTPVPNTSTNPTARQYDPFFNIKPLVEH